MAGQSLVEKIKASIPQVTGHQPWYERVTPQQRAELASILKAWKAGQFGSKRRTAARWIAKNLADIGVSIGEQGVDTWLQRS